MEIDKKIIKGISVYSLKGQILLGTQNEYKKYFNRIAEEESHSTVILNLSGIGYINTAGVGMIIECFKRFKENGGRLVLCSLVPQVATLLEIIKLTGLIEIYPDEKIAIQDTCKGGCYD